MQHRRSPELFHRFSSFAFAAAAAALSCACGDSGDATELTHERLAELPPAMDPPEAPGSLRNDERDATSRDTRQNGAGGSTFASGTGRGGSSGAAAELGDGTGNEAGADTGNDTGNDTSNGINQNTADAGVATDPSGDGEPALPAPRVPCKYHLEWSARQTSHEGCSQIISALPQAREARWDGQNLSLIGAVVPMVDGKFENMQLCAIELATHDVPFLWRFEESLELHEPLPLDTCASPITATYRYGECKFLYDGGGVCSREQTPAGDANFPPGNACDVTAIVTLIPEGPDDGAPQDIPPLPLCEGLSTPLGPLARPVADGEECYSTAHCEAGSYCAKTLQDETINLCSSLGTCQKAPLVSECDNEAIPTPTCDGGCQYTLPAHGNVPANPCNVRAIMGLTALDTSADSQTSQRICPAQ